MSALKKKTTKKTSARPAAKSKSKGRAPAKGGKPVARPARRIIPAVPPLKAKSRGEKAAQLSLSGVESAEETPYSARM